MNVRISLEFLENLLAAAHALEPDTVRTENQEGWVNLVNAELLQPFEHKWRKLAFAFLGWF